MTASAPGSNVCWAILKGPNASAGAGDAMAFHGQKVGENDEKPWDPTEFWICLVDLRGPIFETTPYLSGRVVEHFFLWLIVDPKLNHT